MIAFIPAVVKLVKLYVFVRSFQASGGVQLASSLIKLAAVASSSWSWTSTAAPAVNVADAYGSASKWILETTPVVVNATVDAYGAASEWIIDTTPVVVNATVAVVTTVKPALADATIKASAYVHLMYDAAANLVVSSIKPACLNATAAASAYVNDAWTAASDFAKTTVLPSVKIIRPALHAAVLNLYDLAEYLAFKGYRLASPYVNYVRDSANELATTTLLPSVKKVGPALEAAVLNSYDLAEYLAFKGYSAASRYSHLAWVSANELITTTLLPSVKMVGPALDAAVLNFYDLAEYSVVKGSCSVSGYAQFVWGLADDFATLKFVPSVKLVGASLEAAVQNSYDLAEYYASKGYRSASAYFTKTIRPIVDKFTASAASFVQNLLVLAMIFSISVRTVAAAFFTAAASFFATTVLPLISNFASVAGTCVGAAYTSTAAFVTTSFLPCVSSANVFVVSFLDSTTASSSTIVKVAIGSAGPAAEPILAPARSSASNWISEIFAAAGAAFKEALANIAMQAGVVLGNVLYHVAFAVLLMAWLYILAHNFIPVCSFLGNFLWTVAKFIWKGLCMPAFSYVSSILTLDACEALRNGSSRTVASPSAKKVSPAARPSAPAAASLHRPPVIDHTVEKQCERSANPKVPRAPRTAPVRRSEPVRQPEPVRRSKRIAAMPRVCYKE
jgi:hypothetical protein